MLLPTKNKLILVEEQQKRVRVTYKDQEWIFPRGDCVLLPIENTTAEMLARYIAHRLLADIRDQYGYVPEVLRVEVEESFGQSAEFEMTR